MMKTPINPSWMTVTKPTPLNLSEDIDVNLLIRKLIREDEKHLPVKVIETYDPYLLSLKEMYIGDRFLCTVSVPMTVNWQSAGEYVSKCRPEYMRCQRKVINEYIVK